MESSQEVKITKKEVMCERCQKALDTGDCPRCAGIRVERDKGIYLKA